MQRLFFCVLLSICATTFSQSPIEFIYYTYDQAGNRTGRIIVTPENLDKSPRNNAPVNDNSEEDDDVSDDILADADLQSVPSQEPSQAYEAKIYPNPTADVLNIKVSNSEPLHYILHNGTGVQLLNGSFTSEVTLQISGYARGIYYLSIYGDTGSNNYTGSNSYTGSKSNSSRYKNAADNSSYRRVWKIVKQ